MNANFLLNDQKREQFACLIGIILQLILLLILSKLVIFHKSAVSEKVRVVIQTHTGTTITEKVNYNVETEIIEETPKSAQSEQINTEYQTAEPMPALETTKAEPIAAETKQKPVEKKITTPPKKTPPEKQKQTELSEIEQLEKLLATTKKISATPSEAPSKYKIDVFENKQPAVKDRVKSAAELALAAPSAIENLNPPASSAAAKTDQPENSGNKKTGATGLSTSDKPIFNDNIFNSGATTDYTKTPAISGNDNYSARTPGIVSSPALDATDLLKKGEHHTIRFRGIIDSSGFVKELIVIKTSGFLKLDATAKQHIINNWRWTPGFDNAQVNIELRVEKKTTY